MRMTVPIIAAGLVGAMAAAAPGAAPVASRTVPCKEVIDRTPWPYAGNRQPRYRYRLVLASVAVPPPYLEQVVDLHQQRWRYWSKAGLVVRGNGKAVTVSVPKAWRTRVAILWGNGEYPAAASLRIASCGSGAATGNGYAGGFLLSSPSACVPLIFTVGTRSATVRFGVGRRCAWGRARHLGSATWGLTPPGGV